MGLHRLNTIHGGARSQSRSSLTAVEWQVQLLHYHRLQRLKLKMQKSTSSTTWVQLTEEEAVQIAIKRSLSDVEVDEWELLNVTSTPTPSEPDENRKLAEKLDREEAEEGSLALAVKNSLDDTRPKAEAGPRRFSGNIPFYVIFSCTRKPDLEGIHQGLWEEVQKQLPGGALTGSGAVDCKKFNDLDAAKAYYRLRNRSNNPMRGISLFRYPSAR